MVTKAIIEEVINNYQVKVRIPTLDSTENFSTSTSKVELSTAIVCVQPRSTFVPEVGDIVIVSFEDNDKGKPIIIGCLFKESDNLSQVDLTARNLTVNEGTLLSKNTQIGDIDYNQLKYLQGLQEPVQQALNNIVERLNKLEGK